MGSVDVEALWALLGDERAAEALRGAQKALRRAKGLEAAELSAVAGAALLDLERPAEALAAYERAAAADPDEVAWRVGRGEALYELWRFDEACAALAEAAEALPDDARTQRLYAEALDRAGRRKDAERRFRRAHALDPQGSATPYRLKRKAFDRLVREAIRALPQPIQDRLGPIGFLVEDYPWPEALEPGMSPRTLGIFHATPLPSRYDEVPPGFVPEHIIIFQRNLESLCSTREDLLREIETTVWHEVGHYLGYDEDGLEALGLG